MATLPTSNRSRRQAKSPDRPRAHDVDAIVQGLRRVVKALEAYSREVELTFGVTGPQLWALKTLERSGPLPVTRLAEELAVHQTSASLLVSRLEHRGLLRRERSGQDRRVVLLSLTLRGKAIASRAPEAAQGRLMHGLLAMPGRDVRRIRSAVDQIVAAMEVEDIEATFFFAGE
ncbi:MAG: MarR family transcriptional regulator [Gemmatimonadota bacterium]